MSCPFWAALEGELGKTKLCTLENSALCQTLSSSGPLRSWCIHQWWGQLRWWNVPSWWGRKLDVEVLMALILLGPVTGDAHWCLLHRGQELGSSSWVEDEVERLGMMKDTSAHSAWEAGVALGDTSVSLSRAAQFWYSTALFYCAVLVLDLFVSLSHVFHLFLCLGSLVSEAMFGEGPAVMINKVQPKPWAPDNRCSILQDAPVWAV